MLTAVKNTTHGEGMLLVRVHHFGMQSLPHKVKLTTQLVTTENMRVLLDVSGHLPTHVRAQLQQFRPISNLLGDPMLRTKPTRKKNQCAVDGNSETLSKR